MTDWFARLFGAGVANVVAFVIGVFIVGVAIWWVCGMTVATWSDYRRNAKIRRWAEYDEWAEHREVVFKKPDIEPKPPISEEVAEAIRKLRSDPPEEP